MSVENFSVGDTVRLDLIKIREALKSYPDVYQYYRNYIGDGIFTIKGNLDEFLLRIMVPNIS